MPGPYCRSKFLAEQAAREAAAGGLPVVIVNPTMPIGPGDDLLTPPSKMILGFLNGETPAYLDCEFNLVDARDVAAGQILAADKGRVGERYILGNVNLSLGELLAELQRLTGLAMPRTRIPYALAIASALVERRHLEHHQEAADRAHHRRAARAHLDGVRLQQGAGRTRLVVPHPRAIVERRDPLDVRAGAAAAFRW